MVRVADTAPHPQVLGDLVPGGRLRDVGLVVAYLGAVKGSSSGSVEVSGSPVPITAQSLVVIGGGIALGPFRASVASVAHGILGVAGVRGFSPGSRASRGYVTGFLLAAPAVGHLAARGTADRLVGAMGVATVGHAIVLAAGAAHLWQDGSHRVWERGVRPFLPGAVVKSATLAVTAAVVRRLAVRAAWGYRGTRHACPPRAGDRRTTQRSVLRLRRERASRATARAPGASLVDGR